jgi:ABC-type phosphate transport system permease subunit
VPLLLPGNKRVSAPKHTLHRVQGAVLHALHCFYSYNIMLLVMTFNIGVVVAICLGFGLGFYMHGYGRNCSANQLCH